MFSYAAMMRWPAVLRKLPAWLRRNRPGASGTDWWRDKKGRAAAYLRAALFGRSHPTE